MMPNYIVKEKEKMYNNINNVVDKVIIRGVSNMSDVNKLLDEAIKETENLKEGEIFLVKDLFKGYLWNRIPRKDRLLLGTLFLNQINKMDGKGIKAIEKTSSNQQKYMKV
jgi:predicted RecB family endonuclease